MKKAITLEKLLILGILILCIPLTSYNQSIKRQSISCNAISIHNKNVLIEQTVGQSYSTVNNYDTKTSVLQGFQQPKSFFIEKTDDNHLYELDVDIFPNPANYFINIKFNEDIDNSLLDIYDINGKKILNKELFYEDNMFIDCSTWKNGTYIIKLNS